MPTQKQLDNLKKGKATQFKSGEVAARCGQKGGIASGQAKRRNKTIAEMAKTFASLSTTDPKAKAALAKFGIDDEDATQGMILVASMFKAATKGNVAAAKLVAEWMDAAPLTLEEQSSDPLSIAFETLERDSDE